MIYWRRLLWVTASNTFMMYLRCSIDGGYYVLLPTVLLRGTFDDPLTETKIHCLLLHFWNVPQRIHWWRPPETTPRCLWVHWARRVGGVVSGAPHCRQEVLGPGPGRHGTQLVHWSSWHLRLLQIWQIWLWWTQYLYHIIMYHETPSMLGIIAVQSHMIWHPF